MSLFKVYPFSLIITYCILRIAYCVLRISQVGSHASRLTPHASRVLLFLLVGILLLGRRFLSWLRYRMPTLTFLWCCRKMAYRLTWAIISPSGWRSATRPDSQVILPQLPEEWEGFDVVDQTASTTVEQSDGTAITTKDIGIALFEPGQYQTPALIVVHRLADGSIEELATPVIPFNIESVLVEGDTELRDLKSQAELPLPPLWPWIVLGLLLSTLLVGTLVGAGLWAYHRRQQRALISELPLPVIDTRPPEVIAYAELNRIRALDLPAKNQLKEHYSLVTNCLRQYIEGRYQISALEQTTTELRDAFARSLIPTENVRGFVNLFVEGDLVKFARFRPHIGEAYGLINKAQAMVEVTTPQPEPADARPEPEREVVA